MLETYFFEGSTVYNILEIMCSMFFFGLITICNYWK